MDSDDHIAVMVGPIIREIYGETAELGHYKLAIAIWKSALASHAPSALNRNDTIEYWMTRATTAELKLQEFAKVLYEISARSAAEVGGSMADQLNEPGDQPKPTPVIHPEGDSE